MKLANRLVSLLLAAGMTVSFVPVSAFADTGGYACRCGKHAGG